MAHDVFISHSHSDRSFALAACTRLESGGVRCWIAPRDVPPGSDWPDAITKAVASSRVMVIIYSAAAVESDQIKREITLAANRGLVIVPVRIEDTPPSGAFAYYLEDRHWLDAITPPVEQHIALLVSTVQHILSQTRGDAAGHVVPETVVPPINPSEEPTIPLPDRPAIPQEPSHVAPSTPPPAPDTQQSPQWGGAPQQPVWGGQQQQPSQPTWGAQQQQPSQPNWGGQQAAYVPPPAGPVNGIAVLVASIVSVCICPVVGQIITLIMGGSALSKMKQPGADDSQRGYAIAGNVVAIVSLVSILIWSVTAGPTFIKGFMEGYNNSKDGSSSTGGSTGSSSTTGGSASGIVPDGWSPYTSTDGKYNVNFPGTPKTGSQPVSSDAGSATQYTASCSSSSGSFFETGYEDFPPDADSSDPSAILQRAEKGSLDSAHATLTSDSAITLNGVPGREINATGTTDGISMILHEHIYLSGRRLYMLVMAVPTSADNQTDVSNFFGSFQISQ